MENREELSEYYNRLDALITTEVIVDAYGVYDVDADVLSDFYELFCEYDEKNTPVWAESYIQLYSWQFQHYHEGLDTYYENLYGHTGYEETKKAAGYLKNIGYEELAEKLYFPAQVLCNESEKEEEIENYKKELEKSSKWVEENEEMIYRAYIDILNKNKESVLDKH